MYLIDAHQVIIEELEFSPLERKIYDSIYDSAKRNFEQLDAKGLVGKNYTHILAMLMRYIDLLARESIVMRLIPGCGVPYFIAVLFSQRMMSVRYLPLGMIQLASTT